MDNAATPLVSVQALRRPGQCAGRWCCFARVPAPCTCAGTTARWTDDTVAFALTLRAGRGHDTPLERLLGLAWKHSASTSPPRVASSKDYRLERPPLGQREGSMRSARRGRRGCVRRGARTTAAVREASVSERGKKVEHALHVQSAAAALCRRDRAGLGWASRVTRPWG